MKHRTHQSSKKPSPTPSHFEQGQSMVEFTISMIVMLFIMMGLYDLGRLYFIYIQIQDSVAEGAIFLSINPTCLSSAVSSCEGNNNVVSRIQNAIPDLAIEPENIIVDVGTGQVGSIIEVIVKYDYFLFTPIISEIAGVNPLTITSSATQIVLSN